MDETLFTSGWALWLIAAAVFVIIELVTNTFACFCLMGGCLVAFLAAVIGFGLNVQLAAAIIGIVITFIAFKPLIRKQAASHRADSSPSNMDALIGRTTTVTEAIGENTAGRVRIDGDSWQAVAADGKSIAKGTTVRVVSYDSIVLTVETTEK